MFGKDKDKTYEIPRKTDENMSAPPLKPFSKKGSHAPSAPGKPPATPVSQGAASRTEIPRRIADIPGVPGRRAAEPVRSASRNSADSRTLVVGREISLSGEITSCETLVVEGKVEATIADAQLVEVLPTGLYKGEARVTNADISGRFEGSLVATDTLTVREGGKVSGSIRYGKIIIEAGGQISGDMQSLDEGQGND